MSNKRIILHIDMNSYFASVEQQANPFLRGKAVGVCAYLSPNGCIIASSMEAKKKGIKTGCKVRDAKKLDPSTILLENEPAKYRSTTERIFNIFTDYTAQDQRMNKRPRIGQSVVSSAVGSGYHRAENEAHQAGEGYLPCTYYSRRPEYCQ